MPGKHRPDAVATKLDELDGKVAKRTLLPGRYIPVTAIRDAWLVEQGAAVQVYLRRRRPDHLGDCRYACSRVPPATWSRSATSTAARSSPAPSWPTAPSGSVRHDAQAGARCCRRQRSALQPALADGSERRRRKRDAWPPRHRRRYRDGGLRPASTERMFDGGRLTDAQCAARPGRNVTHQGRRLAAGIAATTSSSATVSSSASAAPGQPRDNQLVGYGLVIGFQARATACAIRPSPSSRSAPCWKTSASPRRTAAPAPRTSLPSSSPPTCRPSSSPARASTSTCLRSATPPRLPAARWS